MGSCEGGDMNEARRTTARIAASGIAAGAAGLALGLACAAPPPNYPEQLSRWQGESEADLVSTWGMPQSTHVLADGGRVLEYRETDDGERCTTRFTLDSSGTIMRWWYAGVKCAAPATSR